MDKLQERSTTYELAVLLKSKGFPQDVDGKLMYMDNETFSKTVVIPNFHQVHKWLMEYKHIYVLPKYLPKVTPHWFFKIYTDDKLLLESDEFLMDYDDAIVEGVKKAMKFVKKNS